ncbi:MAG: AtzE family amidohydrolase, partial [Sphingomonadales bacterium]|nr:AtzE family amidohydrolase [Sphingomonadales bacterium]
MTAERPTLARLAADLASGAVSATDLTEACLDIIDAEDGQGRAAFVHVDRAGARIAAKAVDKMRESGAALSPFAGIPIAIKDLFDVAGQVTRAGSKVLNGPPARADAVAVRRLRQAGF